MELSLSSFSTRQLVLLVGLFCALLLLCLFLGIFASPGLLVTQDVSFEEDQEWVQHVFGLSPLNQGLMTTIVLLTQHLDATASKRLEATVTVRARHNEDIEWSVVSERRLELAVLCVEREEKCGEVEVARVPYISFAEYQIGVRLLKAPTWIIGATITSEFVNSKFTMFELISRAVFALLALGFGGLFWWRLKRVPFAEWADEQKWTLLLLVSLFGLDDPFFVLSVKFAFFDAVDQLMAAWFLSVLLLFWLVMLDSMMRVQETSSRSFKLFYLPKLALVGAFWAAVSSLYLTAELLDDFTHPAVVACFILMLVFASVYLFWIVFLVIKLIPMLQQAQLRVRFFSLFTAVVMVLTIAGIVFGFLGPLRESATQFLAFFGLFNFYTFVMIICYLPGPESPPPVAGDRIQLSGNGLSSDLEDFSTNDFEISLSDVGMQQPTRSFSPIQDGLDDDNLL